MSMCSMGVQVNELTEKARTDSTDRPSDPASKFLKTAKVHFDSQKYRLRKQKYNLIAKIQFLRFITIYSRNTIIV